MPTPGDFKNNPLYADISKLDHLSPQPNFSYKWNSLSGRWEPLDFLEIIDALTGISVDVGDISVEPDTETHRLLSGISGNLDEIHVGVDMDHDTETHRLLSGVSGKLSNIAGNITGDITGVITTTPVKLRTKTITQKIEEDFILLESISEEQRYGTVSGVTYGEDRSVMDDIFGTHFSNSRKINDELETGHPDFFIHAEYMEKDRPQDFKHTFHSDSQYGLRQENKSATLINSYELEDYNNLYQRGLVDHVTIFNRSPYPLQFHTENRRFDLNQPVNPDTDDVLFIDPDFAVKIKNDEAGRVFVKRPHTISGYTIDYSITYRVPGPLEIE